VAHPKIEDFIFFFSIWIGSGMSNDGREGDVKAEESMRAGQSPLLYSSSRFDSAGVRLIGMWNNICVRA
jgi:hypothetical protein